MLGYNWACYAEASFIHHWQRRPKERSRTKRVPCGDREYSTICDVGFWSESLHLIPETISAPMKLRIVEAKASPVHECLISPAGTGSAKTYHSS